MSKQLLSEAVRKRLAESLPYVEQHKHALIDRMEEGLAAEASRDDAFGQPEITAMMLVEMLLVRVRELLDHGELSGLSVEWAEHERMAISGRHYSRFGDLLVAVMKDLLGPNVPADVPGAWCSAFWAIIRQMQEEREAVYA